MRARVVLFLPLPRSYALLALHYRSGRVRSLMLCATLECSIKKEMLLQVCVKSFPYLAIACVVCVVTVNMIFDIDCQSTCLAFYPGVSILSLSS